MNNSGTFNKLRPLSLLRHLSNSSDSTCLQVSSNSVLWSVYLRQGKILYATNSIEPFDRLERHLRRLSHIIPNLTSDIRIRLRIKFERHSHFSTSQEVNSSIHGEYQAICWLLKEQHLNQKQAAILIQELVKEVIESLLLVKDGNYQFGEKPNQPETITIIDVENIINHSQDRLRIWLSLAPQINSPFQRPYLWIPNKFQEFSLPGIDPNIARWMKGFSLRHLAVIINQDELQLAQLLHTHVSNGTILLHEPDPPFDKLPLFSEDSLSRRSQITNLIDRPFIYTAIAPTIKVKDNPQQISQEKDTIIPQEELVVTYYKPIKQSQNLTLDKNKTHVTEIENVAKIESPINEAPVNKPIFKEPVVKQYKIVSVDDSPTILREISRLLEEENLSVITVSDSVKAVMSIIRHKPDLILLDLNMEGINGYELCRIIRNNSKFKDTPIIMVTSNKGLVDKVKARFVGASGYLTKPFTRTELLKMIFMYLT
jgi:two-component system, chemotaxis family, response regulator PixG